MATIELSAYGTIATALSTELNSLASGSSAITAALDNGTDKSIWDDLELVVTFGTAPALNAPVEVYLVPSVDGTNYGDGSSTVLPSPNLLVGTFLVRAVTTAQRVAIRKVELPPGLFKYLVRNQAGQAFAASGNTLKRRPYEMSSA